MTKGLLLLFLVVPCLAEGPQYRHQDKTINLEFQNVYQDIRSVGGVATSTEIAAGSTNYIQNTVTNQTATFNVSSGTVSTEFNIGTGGTILKARSTGEITQPLQPFFLATNAANPANVTGDGTAYTVAFGTEIRDRGADYNNSTFVFTAPVDGDYHCTASIQTDGTTVGAGHNVATFTLATSNRSYADPLANAGTFAGVNSDRVHYTVNSIADMDANDTASIILTVSGGTKVIDIISGAPQNWFSCSLIN